jgi:hypothetical protein
MFKFLGNFVSLMGVAVFYFQNLVTMFVPPKSLVYNSSYI